MEQADRKEKERQQKLLQMAENDPLTGIKNKKAIEKEMLSMVQRAVESHEQITFGFVDIDDFRDYNTNYGHQEGDAVIQFVAQTLKENIHGAVGRIGGDEFAFCYAGELEPERIRHNADKILEILRTQHVTVSYTHLDVYKRQSGYSPEGCQTASAAPAMHRQNFRSDADIFLNPHNRGTATSHRGCKY